jgi:HK97 family phage portal protein
VSANPLFAVMTAGLAPRVKAQTLSGVPGDGGWRPYVRESFGGAWQRGITIDGPRDILSFPGVFAPFTLIASDVAKLRIKLVEEDEDGICTEIDAGSPFLPVLRKPNHFQTRIKFMEQWIVSKLLYGNTYVLKVRDNRGSEGKGIVTKMYVLDANRVTPLVAETGDVYYRLDTDHLSGLPESVTVPASEIIHDMMVCLWHPLVGVSPNYAAGAAATVGRRIQSNSSKFFDNMSRPSGMLTADGKISDELAARLKEEWDNNFSGGNLGRTAVLGEGLKYEAMTIPAEQAQLVEQLELSSKSIAATYHMPLFKVGGPIPVGSTIEAMQQVYYADCLQTFFESAELLLDEGLGLPKNYYTMFDLDGLLRMDQMAAILFEKEAVGAAVKAPNESRKRFNLKPLPGGDSLMMQQQNYSLEALAKRDARDDPFATTPKAAPAATTPVPDAANDAQAYAAVAKIVEDATRAVAEREKESRLRIEAEERASRERLEKSISDREEAARVKRDADVIEGEATWVDEFAQLADLVAQGLEPQRVDA